MKRKQTKTKAEIKQEVKYRIYAKGDVCACIYCKWFGKYRCEYGDNDFAVSAYGTCDNAKNWRER